MIASSRNFAIGMVHFQIGGGWLITGVVLGVYLLLFFGILAMIYYIAYTQPGVAVTDIGRIMLGFLLALQGLALLGVGGYRISSAIRSDISSRMLESHRLMPVTSSRAVLGYLFGPPTPAVAFVLLNVLLSLAFGTWMGGSLQRLVINQFIIFTFAIFAWSIIGLGTFIYRHMFIILFTAMIFGLCTYAIFGAYLVLPGFGLLVTPLLGESMFNLAGGLPGGGTITIPWDLYAIGLAGQSILFGLFFTASCRLYRGTFLTAFSDRQGLLLLATWVLLSAFGIGNYNKFAMIRMIGGFMELDQTLGAVQIVASLLASILIAMVPLWSIVRDPARRPSRAVIICLICALGFMATLPVSGAHWMYTFGVRSVSITMLIVLTQVIIVYCVMRMVRKLSFILAALLIVGAMGASNVIPAILEMLRINFQADRNHQELSHLITFSPMGLVYVEWLRGEERVPELSPVLGCIWQVILASGMLGLTALVTRTRAAKPAAVPPLVAVPTPVPPAPPSGASAPGPR